MSVWRHSFSEALEKLRTRVARYDDETARVVLRALEQIGKCINGHHEDHRMQHLSAYATRAGLHTCFVTLAEDAQPEALRLLDLRPDERAALLDVVRAAATALDEAAEGQEYVDALANARCYRAAARDMRQTLTIIADDQSAANKSR